MANETIEKAIMSGKDIEEVIEKQINEIFSNYYLTDKEIQFLKELIRFHTYGWRRFSNAYANILLVSEDWERQKEFANKLIEILNQMNRNLSTEIALKAYWYKESELIYNLTSLTEEHTVKRIFVIHDCVEEEPSDWEEIKRAYQANDRDLKIVCVNHAVANERFRKDEHLYYRVLNKQLTLREYSAEDAIKTLFSRIENEKDSLEMTEEFREGIRAYIETVYLKADLRKQQFVNDVYRRIVDKIMQDPISDGVVILGAKHIPFYRKPVEKTNIESAEMEPDKRSAQEGSNVPFSDKEKLLKEKENERENQSSDDVIKKLAVRESEKESEVLNILITNVSPVTIRDGKTQKRVYIDERGNKFLGEMTNEAPIKSIAYRLGEKGAYLDKILFIVSGKVRTDKITIEDKKITHLDFLEGKITAFLGENYKDKTEYIDDISIVDEPTKHDVSKTVFEIYDKLLKFAMMEDEVKKRDIHIYIESNGGVRYVLTMLLSLTKTLENYYGNVHISEITSMVLRENPVKIMNTKDVFDTAQITGIADEFVNYGRTNSLRRYFEGYMHELSSDQTCDVRNVLEKLYKTSEDIQLCRTAMILEDFYGSSNIKIMIEEFSKKYKEEANDKSEEKEPHPDMTITIFSKLLQLILNELNQTVYKDVKDTCADQTDPICYLPQMISWCLDKSFTQQALTFCAERLPEYLFKTGKIGLNREFSTMLDQAKKGDYEEKYYFIAHIQDFVGKIKDAKINSVLHIIREDGRLSSINSQDPNFTDEMKVKRINSVLMILKENERLSKLLDVSKIKWDTVFIGDGSQIERRSKKIENIAEKIVDVIAGYIDIDKSTDENNTGKNKYAGLFLKNGFTENDLKRKVNISKGIDDNSLYLTLEEKFKNNSGVICGHVKLINIEDRVARILPVLAEIAVCNINWNEVFITNDLELDERSGALKDIAKKIADILVKYPELVNKEAEQEYVKLFLDNGFEKDDLETGVRISGKIRNNPLKLTLQGKYKKNDGSIEDHLDLKTIEDRIVKILPAMVEILIYRDLLKAAEEDYKNILLDLFPMGNDSSEEESLAEKLYNKYGSRLSHKFFIGDALKTGYIKSAMKADQIQKLLYIYSICKEQRNLSNHAHVSGDDLPIALNTDKLKVVIRALLRSCNLESEV